MKFHFRRFRPGDLEALVACGADTGGAAPLTVESFTENILLDPNLDRDGLIVAVAGVEGAEGPVLGAAYAVTPHRLARGLDPHGGWITMLVVHPGHRRQGIGAGLLQRSEEYLRDGGAHYAEFSSYAPAYFTPGLDLEAHAAALRMLDTRGYAEIEAPVAMRCALGDYVVPDGIRSLWLAREEEGYRLVPAGLGDLPELLEFASTRLDGDWADVLRDSVRRHGAVERIQIAREPAGRIVGFVTHGSYAGPEERFGPFGVDPDQRGKALGKILLHACLESMAARGLPVAWFLWTELDGPAGHLYSSTGFEVMNSFSIRRKVLTGDLKTPTK